MCVFLANIVKGKIEVTQTAKVSLQLSMSVEVVFARDPASLTHDHVLVLCWYIVTI